MEQTNIIDVKKNGELIVDTLQRFKIKTSIENIIQGTTVTRYELWITETEDLRRIVSHSMDIAYHLGVNEDLRIEAPIIGRHAVAIEVPNKNRDPIHYYEYMESNEFSNANSYTSVVIGKNIQNQFVLWDMIKQPNLLLAGVKDSGKTNLLHCMICNILQKSMPEEVKIALIDPNDKEFVGYKNIPHLLDNGIASEPQQILDLLNCVMQRVKERFEIFQKNSVSDIYQYNASDAVNHGERLPHIIIFFDNFEKLIDYSEIDQLISKIWFLTLTEFAIKAGIHIVLSTEPLSNNLTTKIRAGFYNDLIFKLNNASEAKMLVDLTGAEKLLGKGDVLYFPNDGVEERLQTPLIFKQEIADIILDASHN